MPLRLSDKWVAYACRTAGVARPKWNAVREVWTTSVRAEDGVQESIAITRSGDQSVRVKVDWAASDTAPRSTPTARRVVSAIVTAMQWALRRRTAGSAESFVPFR